MTRRRRWPLDLDAELRQRDYELVKRNRARAVHVVCLEGLADVEA